MEAVIEKSSTATRADYAARIEELGKIILAYHEVTDKLQQSHIQLQETVQSLRNELSEKNRQLERKKRLAALGEMAAGMAHEIRNPLGGIQLYASMLARDVRESPASLQLVGKISSGVKHLESLVSQVLQFTREIEAHPVATDLADLVDQAVELSADRIQFAGVTCRIQGPRPMRVNVDPMLIGQALLNLLINAIEAVGGPGTIDVVWSAAEASSQFSLSICDSGPGIPPAVLERIFNPFFTTKATGTGLGLAIVHRIVEAHEGSIVVTNSPPSGAMFEIRI
ncbi:MAG: ATP-binding protein [Planctomycetota bacterium]|nr:ATP-binding protein [Planctomycetota bacterium]